MKVRTGFVSNSSSASFIVKFRSNLKPSKIKKLIKNTGSKDAKLFHGSADEYSFEAQTYMFNDWMDVSEWKLIRALSEDRIDGAKLVSITKTEEEYGDVDYKTNFDRRTWEYEELDNDDKFQYTEDEKLKIKETQNKVDKEYLEYLKTCNQNISQEEIIELTKHLLSK